MFCCMSKLVLGKSCFRKCCKQEKSILYAWIVLSYAFWMIMFAGPKFFGENVPIPFSKSLHFHRFIGGVQVFAIGSCGILIEFLLPSQDWHCILCGTDQKEASEKHVVSVKRNVCNIAKSIALFLLISFVVWQPLLRGRKRMFLSFNSDIIARQKNKWGRSMSQNEFEQIEAVLQGLPPGRIYTGMPGYARWPVMKLFPTLLERDFSMLGPTLHTMAPGDSWIEWMDHGNIDHYHLFNVKYIILPRFIRPPPFLESIPYGNKKKISTNSFRLYKVQTEGYCAVLHRCSNHIESMKFNNCLHHFSMMQNQVEDTVVFRRMK